MAYRPKRQSDIVLVGSGPLVDAVQSVLASSSRKVLHLQDASRAHFLKKGVVVYDGEKIAAKTFLVVMPMANDIPSLKGVEQTEYRVIGQDDLTTLKGNILIVGGGELAVRSAMQLAESGQNVTMVYQQESLLDAYDISVQDVITRYLRKIKVKLLPGHTPLASVTKSKVTYLLTKNGKTSKKLSCTTLLLEPSEANIPDIGLANYGEFSEGIDEPVVIQNNLVLVNDERVITSLSDARVYAKILEGKRSARPSTVTENRSTMQAVEYFSFGVLEQNFLDTHIGYKKSIAKIAIPGSDITGYLKVIVSLKRRIVGISGVVSSNYAGIELLRYAVKNHVRVDDLTKLIDVDDALIHAYHEIYREVM